MKLAEFSNVGVRMAIMIDRDRFIAPKLAGRGQRPP
jgi:hypothetical protein